MENSKEHHLGIMPTDETQAASASLRETEDPEPLQETLANQAAAVSAESDAPEAVADAPADSGPAFAEAPAAEHAERQREGLAVEHGEAHAEESPVGESYSLARHEDADPRVYIAMEREAAERAADQDELERFAALAERWITMGAAFAEALTAAGARVKEVLLTVPATPETLDPEITSNFSRRKNGLELIDRMADRMLTRTVTLKEIELPEIVLPLPMTKDEWSAQIAAQAEPPQTDRKLKQLGDACNQSIVAARALAESRERRVFDLAKNHVLPILDGLFDGEKYTLPLVRQVETAHPNAAEFAAQFLAVYSELRAPFLTALEAAQIHIMTTKRGDDADYELHEAVEDEPDPDLSSEQIISVERHGYERPLASGTMTPLRIAQVIVAKN